MKKTIFWLFSITLLANLFLCVPGEAQGQTIRQTAIINSGKCSTARRAKSSVCRVTCAQRDSILARIKVLENKPVDQRTWADAKDLAALWKKVEDLEKKL